MTTAELNRETKTILWVLGIAEDQLIPMGLISPGVKLGDKGVAMFDQIKAEGFRPTDQEIAGCIAALNQRFGFAATNAGADVARQIRNDQHGG